MPQSNNRWNCCACLFVTPFFESELFCGESGCNDTFHSCDVFALQHVFKKASQIWIFWLARWEWFMPFFERRSEALNHLRFVLLLLEIGAVLYYSGVQKNYMTALQQKNEEAFYHGLLILTIVVGR